MDNVTITDLYNLIREISGQNKQLKDEHIQTRSDIKEEIRTIRSELLEEIKELKEENAQLKKTNCKLEEKLNKVDSKLYLFQTVDEKVNFVTSNLTTLFNIHAPLKTKKTNNKPYSPWFTENLRLIKRMKNDALKRYRQTRLPVHWDYYKQIRNMFTSAYRAEKKTYLNLKFQNAAPKGKWAELRKVGIINKKNNSVPNHLRKLNELNSHFVNVSNPTNYPNGDLLEFYQNNRKVNEHFQFTQVSEGDISRIILGIRTKASGNDDINITMLILCCPFLVPYLTHIVNSCILTSTFPTAWKSANVVPLPKVKEPTEYTQLRSISILPTMSKILERVMAFQISSFVVTHNILPEKQSGFRRGYSCTSALADITDLITRTLDGDSAAVLILLDYTRAFDLINYDIMLSILLYIGFGPDAQALVKSFLLKRKQRVALDGEYSEYMYLLSGVPQGSILGPLLFIIYTSNFIESLQYCDYHIYADDTQILYSFKPNEVVEANLRLNSDLKSLNVVSENHLLKLNPSKSIALLFCSDKVRPNIENNLDLTINNYNICFKKSSKNLGLVMDSKLKFTEHITACVKKSYGALKALYPHRHCLNRKTRVELCEALVLSHFNFADSVYGPYLDSIDSRRIQKVQNSCIRFICGIRRRHRVTHKLKELGWLSMHSRRMLHSLCFFYKILKTLCPSYLHKKISYRTDVHNLNIRRREILTIPRHKKQIFKKGFTYNIAATINKYKITQFDHSHDSFKRKIKKILLDS